MKQFSFILFLFISGLGKSQIIAPEVISPGGDFFTATTFTNSYTVGEISIIETYTGSNFILTQGFQQPDSIFLTSNPISFASNLVFQLYPNPAGEQVNLFVKTDYSGEFEIQMLDILSQQMILRKIVCIKGVNTFSFDISSLANGIYFMNIFSPTFGVDRGMTISSLKFIISK